MNREKKANIDIFGITYDIVEDDFIDQPNAMGRLIEKDQVILIGSKIGVGQKNATLWHEVVHCILSGVGESELSGNEDFVEKLSLALSQTAELKIYNNRIK